MATEVKNKLALPKMIFTSAVEYGTGSIFKGLVNALVPGAGLITNFCRMLACDCAGVYIGGNIAPYSFDQIEETVESVKEMAKEAKDAIKEVIKEEK